MSQPPDKDWRSPIGTRVLIIGKHPHTGKSGTVYVHDNEIFGVPAVAMGVRCDDGANAGISKKENFKTID